MLTDREWEVILAFAESDMSVTSTAKKIYAVRGTVIYWLDKIRKKTGHDPRVFYDLMALINMRKGEHNG